MPRIAEGVHRLGSDLVNFYLVAFGHGDPWREGVGAAVQRAREVVGRRQ